MNIITMFFPCLWFDWNFHRVHRNDVDPITEPLSVSSGGSLINIQGKHISKTDLSATRLSSTRYRGRRQLPLTQKINLS